MIEIIKNGQTKFTGVCPTCNCEFTYELSDLDSTSQSWVPCPCCGNHYYHLSSPEVVPTAPGFMPVTPIPGDFTSISSFSNPCKDCAKTRAEQISEMGWLMCPRELSDRCGDCKSDTIGCTYKIKAEALYDAGYRDIMDYEDKKDNKND